MNITYKELRDLIDAMPKRHLDDTVTVFDEMGDECLPVAAFDAMVSFGKINPGCNAADSLDEGPFVLKVRGISGIEDYLSEGDAVFVDAGDGHINEGDFVKQVDDKHASVILLGHNDESIFELADIYLGEYDEKSLAILLGEKANQN